VVRFVHTGDWQIGMTRRFLPAEAQARFDAARLDAVRAIGRVAGDHDAAFVVVAGDVFESNRLDRRVVVRALEALADCAVPVWLLPGNHDPLDAASVYTSPTFLDHCPEHVRVLGASGHTEVAPGVDLVAAPWRTKHPLADLVGDALEAVAPDGGRLRIVVGHGAVDALSPAADDPGLIALARLEAALADGRAHYVALGDRPSLPALGTTGRVRYPGAPEPTDHAEVAPGHVLVVDLDADDCACEAVKVGTWRFLRRELELDGPGGVDALERWLAAQPDKDRTICRLGLVGTVTVRDKVRIDAALADAAPPQAPRSQ
jgi:DNA repair exonuclease SbcCD nuclease subunit